MRSEMLKPEDLGNFDKNQFVMATPGSELLYKCRSGWVLRSHDITLQKWFKEGEPFKLRQGLRHLRHLMWGQGGQRMIP